MAVQFPFIERMFRKARLPGDGSRTLTLSGALSIGPSHEHVLRVDCNGANRDATFLASQEKAGVPFLIENITAAYNLVVKNSAGTTLHTLTPGESVLFVYDGTSAAWRRTLVSDKHFRSAEQTGNGSSQNIAHGLAATPRATWAMVSDSGATGIYTLVPGAHDATNCKFTVTTGVKYYVFAIK